MNINEIQDLIKFVSKSGVNEVEIEQKDFRITIKSDGTAKRGKKGQKGEGESGQQAFQQVPVGFPAMQPMPQQMPMQQQQPAPQPPPQPAPASDAQNNSGEQKEAPAKGNEEGEDTSKYHTVKSPMIGTFYRSPSPEKGPFVNVGDKVQPGDVLCIVEAMKLFNEIESEVSGKIVKVLVDDASPIEYDQPLFLVDPS